MGGSSKKGGGTQVTDYLMSMHLGISTSVDAFLALLIDKQKVWEGELDASGTVIIDKPDFKGGPTQQGGYIGAVDYLDGNSGQQLSSLQAGKFGLTPSTAPGFRGLATLFFRGNGNSGFVWSTNDPVIAQNVSATVRRAPKTPLVSTEAMIDTTVEVTTVTHTVTSGTVTTTTTNQFVVGTDPGITIYMGDTVVTAPVVLKDANPAHIILEVMLDVNQGMGAPLGTIDIPSFAAGSATLFAEGLGLSILWSDQSSIEDFVNEILNTINGVLYLNPQTGLWTLKLVRADYTVGDLPVFTPDNASMKNYQRKLWGETINYIQVTWTNPINERQEAVGAQNLANIQIQGGVVLDTRQYTGVRTAALASVLAARDVTMLSAPLRSMEMSVDRSAWNITPGSCVVVNWPEYRVEGVVMRVGTVDYGKAGDPAVKVTMIEDIFALEAPPITPAPGTAWSNTSTPPMALSNALIFTLPEYFVLTANVQSHAIPLTYPEVLAAAFGYTLDRNVSGYQLDAEAIDATGGTTWQSAGIKTIVERDTLPTSFVAEATSLFPYNAIQSPDRGPQVGGFAFIGNTDADFEICLVASGDGTNWTLDRGVLDTVPTAWASGTPIWFLNPGASIVDEVTIRASGEEADYKMLPRTSQGMLDIASAPVVDTTLSARPWLPLRPANVQVNGVGFGTVALGGAPNITITWGCRNRLLEEGQAVLWTAASMTPEYEQETVVTITDVTGGTVYYEQGALWTDTSLVLPATDFALYTDIYIKVWSRRSGLASLHSYTMHLSGLPGTMGASPPPAPPTPGLPVSPVGPPAGGAWTATGTAITDGGGSIPAIQIAGTQDIVDALELVVEYRVHGTTQWIQGQTIALNNLPVEFMVSPLGASTSYDVQVAYQVIHSNTNVILTQWQSLGSVTTGVGVSSSGTTLVGVFEATENIAANAQVNLWLSGGVLKMRNADASDPTKSSDGYVTAAVLTGATGSVYDGGVITGLSGLAPIGGLAFLDASGAGGVTATPPTTSGYITQQVGKILTAASILFRWTPPIKRS